MTTLKVPPATDTVIAVMSGGMMTLGNDEGWSDLATSSSVRVYRSSPGTVTVQVRVRKAKKTYVNSANLSTYDARALLRGLQDAIDGGAL